MATAFIKFTRLVPRLPIRSSRWMGLTTSKQRSSRTSARLRTTMATKDITYLTQQTAAAVDEDLMGESQRFSIDQLMELAGLSVASAISQEYSVSQFPKVLVIAGPGNNGGDGLVAARHLIHFGHIVQLAYPIPSNKTLYDNLFVQCEQLKVTNCRPDVFQGNGLKENYDLVVDAVFGFSFKGEPRPPFDKIIDALKPGRNPPPIVSVDIPSGWDVEKGDVKGNGIRPDMLVSLSAPKLCAQQFKGRYHYLGGRFLPPQTLQKHHINLPPYPGSSQCVRLDGGTTTAELQSMRASYKTDNLDERSLQSDPMNQFKIWMEEYTKLGVEKEPNAMALATCGDTGFPSVRFVLLKGLDHGGFVFYTNYNSRKSTQLTENARAGLCFYMTALHRQVRVEGTVHRLSEAESEAYFASRPRTSQIGAWASQQSSPLADRSELDAQLHEVEQRFSDETKPIPKPPFWGGFVVVPLSVEFWQGQESRLHDRCEYRRSSADTDWRLTRLSP